MAATPTAVVRVDAAHASGPGERPAWIAGDEETSGGRLGDRISALPAIWCWLFLLLFLPVGGLVDRFTGTHVTLTAIYFAPVALMTWRFGLQRGLIAGLLCAVSALAPDLFLARNMTDNQHALWNALMLLCSAAVIAILVGRLREYVERLRNTALHDLLTGLPNRVAFSEALRREFSRAARQDSIVSVVVCDCDGFKEVNDRLGHAAGDRLLQEVARQLQAVFRASDMVCRWGGDEFMVLLTDTDAEAAKTAIDRARAQLEAALDAASPGFGMSIGWASALPEGESLEGLLARADAAMYASKRLRAER